MIGPKGERLEESLISELDARLVFHPAEDTPRLALIPKNLLNALWLQLAQVFDQRDRCQKLRVLQRTVQGRPRDRSTGGRAVLYRKSPCPFPQPATFEGQRAMTSNGHIRQRSPGSFELRYSLGTDAATGRRKIATATFRGTRKEAELELRRLLRRRYRGARRPEPSHRSGVAGNLARRG
jgi:hypothetical protein